VTRISAVLFDLDGTLIDSGPGVIQGVAAAAAALGMARPDDERLRQFVGPPLQDAFADLLGLSPEQVAVAVAAFRRDYDRSGIHNFTVYEGTDDMLDALTGQELRLAVATSKPETFARRVLAHSGLARHFSHVAGATMDGTVRRKAQVAFAALAALRTGPEQAVLVGDRRHDVDGARELGMRCVGAAWGYGGIDELLAAGTAAVAARPVDVARAIRRLDRAPARTGPPVAGPRGTDPGGPSCARA